VLLSKTTLHKILILGLTTLLVSCGGGGGSSSELPNTDSTVPVVVETNPVTDINNPASDILISDFITVTFNTAVKDNFDTNNFLLHKYVNGQIDSSSIQAKEISYSTATKTVTFKPAVELEKKTKYHVVVNNVVSSTGIAMTQEYSWDFSTFTPPGVVNIIPADNASNVIIKPKIGIQFSESVLESSLNSNILFDGVPITVVANVDLENTYLYDVPTELARSSFHTITLNGGSNGIKDLAGISIEFSDPVLQKKSWVFQIRPPARFLGQLYPISSQTEVSINTEITVPLNKLADSVSVGNAFSLMNSSGQNIPVTYKYNSRNYTATFTPNTPLVSGIQYTANMNTSAKDTKGQFLGMNLTTTFTSNNKGWTGKQPLVIDRQNDVYQIPIVNSSFASKHNKSTFALLLGKSLKQYVYDSVKSEWISILSPSGNLVIKEIDYIHTVMDGVGNVFTIWQTVNNTGSATSSTIWLNRYSNNTWGIPQKLLDSATAGRYLYRNPILSVSSNGDAIIIWSDEDSTGKFLSYFIRYTIAGGFTSKTATGLVTEIAFEDATMELDSTGNGILAWVSSKLVGNKTVNALNYSSFNNGIFSTSGLVLDLVSTSNFKLVSDKTGKMLLIWANVVNPTISNNPLIDIKAISYEPISKVWGNIQTIGKSKTGYFIVKMNATGNAIIMWSDPLSASNRAVATSIYNGATWGLESTYPNKFFFESYIAISNNNDASLLAKNLASATGNTQLDFFTYSGITKNWSTIRKFANTSINGIYTYGSPFNAGNRVFGLGYDAKNNTVSIYGFSLFYDGKNYGTLFTSHYK